MESHSSIVSVLTSPFAPFKGGLFCYCHFSSYSFIVTDQERTGRDLSLQNSYHEKGYATIASPTIATAATIEMISVFGLSAFDLLRWRSQPEERG
ncbi:MAG TPA: hypothetical protein VIG72_07480 [Pontibacter sp.]